MRERMTRTVRPPVTPLPRFGLETEIAIDEQEPGADPRRVLVQSAWRVRVAADRRLTGSEDAGLLERDLLACVAEILHMVERDAHDERAVGIERVDRIESAAESNLQHRHVDARLHEQPHRGER